MASFCAKCGAEEPGHGDMTMDLPTGSMVTALIRDFGIEELGALFLQGRDSSAASIIDTEDGAIIALPKGQQESVVATITAKPSEHDGKTQIAIVHTTSNKSS